MADAKATGGSATRHRTFDCPWCGAISSIPGDHLGEHFECPECKKSTKLTDKNTSSRKPTAPPQDAPQQPGSRTFDCPWCGRISSIGAEYVGEHFDCPECKKSTKITDKNTRRAAVTTAPADAPHVKVVPAGRKAAIAVVVLAIVGAAAWAAMSSGGASPSKESASAGPGGASSTTPGSAMATEPAAPPAGTPAPAPPAPPAMGTETAPPTSTPPAVPGTTEAAPPTESPPPAAPVTPEMAAAQAALEAAAANVAKAEKRAKAARADLSAWEAKNPDAKDTVSNLATLAVLTKESDRMKGTLDPEKATPDAVRGFNFAMVSFIGDDPNRLRVAQRIFAQLRAYVHGRETIGQAWTSMNFYGAGVERCTKVWEGRWLMAPASPAALRKEESDSAAELAAAKQAQDEAEKALKALQPK